MSIDQALHLAASYQSIVQHTADHQEGVSALLEKRKPVFTGK
jgi:2-(1,2-epoxy-1,2-dihydrophenyl)acetyl-CoA isomerase